MRFQIVGHACLWAEAGGATFLVDPWLSGSCYWRAWWHFPPAVAPPEPAPDYIYVSHHHFDHLHYPSLRTLASRCASTTTVLIPEFAVDVMREEIESVGFKTIVELPHGRPREIVPGVRIGSYQFGFDDSAFVLGAEGHVLADLNDCKINGPAARSLLNDFGPPTFLFKSHSFAQAFPNCYEFDDVADIISLTADDYCATLLHSARELNAKNTIPFASMVAFLHPEAEHCNQHLVTPQTAADFVRNAGFDAHALEPGEGWSSETGFLRNETSAYADRDRGLARVAEQVAPKLAAAAEQESRRKADFAAFEAHLGEFVSSVPPGAGRLLPRPVVFEVPSDTACPYWVIDVRRRRVYRSGELPDDWASIVRVSEAVLADAIEKNVLNFIHISMRVRIRAAPGGVSTDLAFWGFLLTYEMGYFRWSRLLNARTARVLWRRRAEFLHAASLAASSLTSGKSVTQGLVDNLLARDD